MYHLPACPRTNQDWIWIIAVTFLDLRRVMDYDSRIPQLWHRIPTFERSLQYADREGGRGVSGEPQPVLGVRLAHHLQLLLQLA